MNLATGIPFDLACLAIGLVLSLLGTLVFRQPNVVAVTVDAIILLVLPYLPPFKLPGTKCIYVAHSTVPCDQVHIAASVPLLHWIGAAVILITPFIWGNMLNTRLKRHGKTA